MQHTVILSSSQLYLGFLLSRNPKYYLHLYTSKETLVSAKEIACQQCFTFFYKISKYYITLASNILQTSELL